MTTSGSNTSTVVNMTPWLHTSGGDFLFFRDLTPTSKGAIAAAAVVLFLLAVFDRWVAAMRGVMEARWRDRAKAVASGGFVPLKENTEICHTEEDEKDAIEKTTMASSTSRKTRTIAPFIPSIDIARGAFQVGQSLLVFAFMLVIMTFQVAYIVAIVIGLGVGEVAFGRFSFAAGAPSH